MKYDVELDEMIEEMVAGAIVIMRRKYEFTDDYHSKHSEEGWNKISHLVEIAKSLTELRKMLRNIDKDAGE